MKKNSKSRNSKVAFSPKEEAKLIEYVKEHPILYDKNLNSCENRKQKDKLWTNIAFILWKTARQCERKWLEIEKYYINCLRKGTCILFPNPWSRKRNELLQFLNSHLEIRRSEELLPEPDTSSIITRFKSMLETKSDYSHISSGETKNNIISVQLNNKLNDLVDQFNDMSSQSVEIDSKHSSAQISFAEKSSSQNLTLDQFFSSMCGTVKSFPKVLQAKAKISIAQLIGEMEVEYLGEINS